MNIIIIIKIAYFKKTLDLMYTTLYIVYHPIYCIPPYILYTTLYIVYHPIYMLRHGCVILYQASWIHYEYQNHQKDRILQGDPCSYAYHPIYCIPPYILYAILYVGSDMNASFYIKQVKYIMNHYKDRILQEDPWSYAYHPIYCIPSYILYATLHIVYRPIYCMPPYT